MKINLLKRVFHQLLPKNQESESTLSPTVMRLLSIDES